jgi:hypothetical protein
MGVHLNAEMPVQEGEFDIKFFKKYVQYARRFASVPPGPSGLFLLRLPFCPPSSCSDHLSSWCGIGEEWTTDGVLSQALRPSAVP